MNFIFSLMNDTINVETIKIIKRFYVYVLLTHTRLESLWQEKALKIANISHLVFNKNKY